MSKLNYLHVIRNAALVLVLGHTSAWATGTPAGTTINSVATLSYMTKDNSPMEILSSPDDDPANAGVPTAFKVGTRLNALVAPVSSAAINVAPGQTGGVATFSVINTGNTLQDFALSVVNIEGSVLFGKVDNFDVMDCQVYAETNDVPGYQSGIDTAAFIDELAPDSSKAVYVTCNIPPNNAGDQAIIGLRANIHAANGPGELGDAAQTRAANNKDEGSYSSRHAYLIAPASIPEKR